MNWKVEVSWGTAGEFHQRPLPDDAGRTVWLHKVDAPALVLGSAQPESHLDLEAASRDGLETCRRRSGGGAVLVTPEDCWIDVVIPSDDPLWSPDVGKAFYWLGELWASVLGELGVADCLVHTGPALDRELGRVACFAGLGLGEVTAGEPVNGSNVRRKVVGLSQRRTRQAARFQSLVPFGPDLSRLQRYVVEAGVDVAERPVGVGLEQDLIADAFLSALR